MPVCSRCGLVPTSAYLCAHPPGSASHTLSPGCKCSSRSQLQSSQVQPAVKTSHPGPQGQKQEDSEDRHPSVRTPGARLSLDMPRVHQPTLLPASRTWPSPSRLPFMVLQSAFWTNLANEPLCAILTFIVEVSAVWTIHTHEPLCAILAFIVQHSAVWTNRMHARASLRPSRLHCAAQCRLGLQGWLRGWAGRGCDRRGSS